MCRISEQGTFQELRDSNGPFASVDDLLAITGIGPAPVEGIRDLVEAR